MNKLFISAALVIAINGLRLGAFPYAEDGEEEDVILPQLSTLMS